MADFVLESTPQVSVNNIAISVCPNTVKFTEGEGEDTYKTQSSGGLGVSVVYGRNVEKAYSEISFEMEPTSANIELIKTWKLNSANNTMTITGNTITRSFSSVALTNNYEVNLAPDKNISLEFKADKAS